MQDPKNQPQATITKLKGCLWPSLRVFLISLLLFQTNYTVWPLLQIINFKFVPLQYQVLYLSCGLFFWNIYLSHMANRKEKVNEKVKEMEQSSVNETDQSSVNETDQSSTNKSTTNSTNENNNN